MSLFQVLKQLIAGDLYPAESMSATSDGTLTAPTQVESSSALMTASVAQFWSLATGTFRNVHQERTVSYHNSQISGRCVGRIGELSGALMLYPFEDMPTWLTSLHLRLTVEAEAGEVRISLLEPSGSITTLTAPCTLAGQFAITDGRLPLRCETDATSARGLCYEAVII